MALLLTLTRRSLPLKTLAQTSPSIFSSCRSYISDMRRSALKENLLRILRTEITYESEYRPPQPPETSFDSFSVQDNLGEQWVQLRRKYGDAEDIKIDATMFDDAIPPKTPASAGGEDEPRLHISLIVEVFKGDSSRFSLQFVCSAWYDSLEVEKVYAVSRESATIRPFMGPNFKDLDDDLQDALRSYLEARGVNDNLAEFLHDYMQNKDKMEFIRWLKNVEAYVSK